MMDAAERLWRRLLLAVGRGRIASVDDAGQVQKMQVKLGSDETIDAIPRLAEYGFQSRPPVGSDAVLIFVAGERSNGVVIACGNQTFRMRSLESGEVAISDDKGQSVHLSADGIKVNGGGLPVNITNTPQVTIDSADVQMTGRLTVDGDILSKATITALEDVRDQNGAKSMAAMRGEYNVHQHGTSVGPHPAM